VNGATDPRCDERFLICAPTGRDGSLTRTLLAKSGVDSLVCADVVEVCERAEREGCAGLLLAEEVLAPTAFVLLRSMLSRQQSWSDLPILLFTARSSLVRAEPLASLGYVTLLERPLRPLTMRSAVLSALRARRRQYAARADLYEQQRAVQQRDQFLAMLGHELRNPLSAIAMAVKLDDANEGSFYRAVVERQTEHLSRLVDDLLDVARVTSGKVVLRRAPLDIVALVRRSADALGNLFATQRVALAVELPGQPLLVDGDAVRLEQIVANLLTNAAKYTPAGGRVEVAVEARAGEVVISVRDDGVGMAPEMLPRVFDLFTQVESTLDRAKGGMGIGLTLVRSLVELHRGRVEASSAGHNQGSVFTVYLPECIAPPVLEGPASNRQSDGHKRAHVLIVEDNADSRELLRLGLSRRGHRVSASADGLAGVETALKERPEAMLVDIGLPGLDGYGVARRVRSALGSSVYLVALTGYGQPEDRMRALDAGFDVHLTKPVDVAELDQLLGQRAQ